MKSKELLALVVGIGLVLILTVSSLMGGCTTPAEPEEPEVFELGMASFLPTIETSAGQLWVGDWINEVEQATEGRVQITHHPFGSVCSPAEIYDAVYRGTVELGFLYPQLNPGYFPMTEIFSVPPSDIISDHMGRIFWELYEAFPEMQEEYAGVELLFTISYANCGIGANTPITSLADMEGMKFQAPGVWAGKQVEAWGASAMSIPEPDIVMALQTGVVDGMMTHWAFLAPFPAGGLGFGELLKYYTEINCFTAPFIMIMNKDVWNSLPSDIQEAIESVSGLERVDVIDAANWQMMEVDCKEAAEAAYGCEEIRLAPEEMAEFAEAMLAVQAEYLEMLEDEGKPAQEFWDEFIRLLTGYERVGYL